MSASCTALYRCCHRSVVYLSMRRQWTSSSLSSSPPPPLPRIPLHRKILLSLARRFYDVEMLLELSARQSKNKLRRKNAYYAFTQKHYGANIASAYYILCLKGGFRFVGQSEWYRPNQRGKFNWDFLNHKDKQLEEVDMSHTIITYNGLENLKSQQSLRTLKLQGCKEVDDWFLPGLHIFQDCLEELDISHCPHITVGGLVALRNLKLKRLNISSLPKISNPGLVVILLEEMLPKCLITADGYNYSLSKTGGAEEEVEEEIMQRNWSQLNQNRN